MPGSGESACRPAEWDNPGASASPAAERRGQGGGGLERCGHEGRRSPHFDAHEIVGKAVALGVKTGRDLSEMKLEELQEFSNAITQDVFEVLTLEGSVAARNHLGGTAPERVKEAAAKAKDRLG